MKAIGSTGTGRGGLRGAGQPLPSGCRCVDAARRMPGFAADKDVPALDAYRHAAKADPENADARQAPWLASRKFFVWIRPGEAYPSGNARDVGMKF